MIAKKGLGKSWNKECPVWAKKQKMSVGYEEVQTWYGLEDYYNL
jgi:hypothetical protein